MIKRIFAKNLYGLIQGLLVFKIDRDFKETV